MANTMINSILFFFFFSSTTMFASTSAADIKGGYWPSWLQNTLPPSAIPASYYTHVFYAFAGISSSKYQLVVKPEDEQWMPIFTTSLHSKTPSVITMLSIGGGDSSNRADFAAMASSPSNRANFISSTIQVARRYNFDGLDLDWEYPLTQAAMVNLGTLLTEWRAAINEEAGRTGKPRLLLTAAVYFTPSAYILSSELTTYPAQAVRDSLDFVNLMCYDYRGDWDTSKTGAHALLYDPSSQISTSAGIQAWINAGLPANKLIMGLPMYGRTWKLRDANVNGIGAPAVGVGPGGGVLTYADVVDFNGVSGTQVVYDARTVSMYSYRGTDWVGYDSPTTIDVKVKYARDNRLGGYFFWRIGQEKNWELTTQALRSWAR
ncbi:hypothetical protein C5167_031484 [Papaver somniferum]|uniref:GH18 domain-containing protein n=1 Tax=Papaver somniferum TaxID=3469 RepID=A0A4Y7K5X0_PAPSO|nr:class V chitinase-like [Papaver somniferum]RZC68226.1 hypothetical protein C5167_031484 [Papaver somniferum]